MKKIFTMLLATTLLSTAFAQYSGREQPKRNNEPDVYAKNDNRGYERNENVGYDRFDNGHKGRYYFTPRERDMQIDRINSDYNYRIQAVRNRYFVNWRQKKQMIMSLDAQREQEIRDVIYRFNDRRNKFGDGHYKDKHDRW